MTKPSTTPADEYETSDLRTAAFLLARDLPLLRDEPARAPSGERRVRRQSAKSPVESVGLGFH